MATVQITNVSPLGELEVPILGCNVGRGETIEVDVEIAGAVPDPLQEGDVGIGLLAQTATWAPAVAASVAASKKTATPPSADVTPPVKTNEGE